MDILGETGRGTFQVFNLQPVMLDDLLEGKPGDGYSAPHSATSLRFSLTLGKSIAKFSVLEACECEAAIPCSTEVPLAFQLARSRRPSRSRDGAQDRLQPPRDVFRAVCGAR